MLEVIYFNNFTFIPFTQCQNARFIIIVSLRNSTLTPDWIITDQNNKTITVITQNVKSVILPFEVNIKARMVTIFTDDNIDKITTDTYLVTFTFLNENWKFLSSNHTNYLVLNKLTVFSFEFEDNENDLIILKAISKSLNNYFIKRLSNTTKTINLVVEATEATEDLVKVDIQYADSYHQADSFYSYYSFDLNIFITEPPIFNEELSIVHANRCSNYSYKLPNIWDPNSLKYIVSIDSNPIDWIKLNNINMTIELETGNDKFDISLETVIGLKVTNYK